MAERWASPGEYPPNPPVEVRCGVGMLPGRPSGEHVHGHARQPEKASEGGLVGSVIKKRRKRMAKKKHRKLLRKTRVQRRNKK
jgi:Mitochondrial domain of unknown function (DUF1713)